MIESYARAYGESEFPMERQRTRVSVLPREA